MGVPGLARRRVPGRAAATPWFAHYADAVRHRRAQQHLLPAADRRDGRAWAAQAPPGFVYAVKLGRVRLAPDEAARRGVVAAEPPRSRRAGSAPRSGPTLVQLPPRWRCNVERLDEFLSRGADGHALGGRATRSVVAARRRLRRAAHGTAPRCACTICCPASRGC